MQEILNIIIVGAGGFARELRQFVPSCFPPDKYRLKGFLSNNPRDLDRYNLPEPILGDPEDYVPEPNDRFLLAIGNVEHRRRIVEELKSHGGEFLTFIHPTAYVDSSATLGEGCIIYPFVTIMNQARLADYVTMNIYSSAGHDTQIGSHCNLSPYATMNGFSVLEDEVVLGTHSTVLASHRVGHGSKVSANSAVTSDVRPNTLVYGVPGQHTRLLGGGTD
jgi:sugar O-acyltransferase (sialic acid O-acetyltransferase NeuD family)